MRNFWMGMGGLVALVASVTSCAAYSALSKASAISSNAPMRPGDVVLTTEDSVMREVQGTTLEKGNHRVELRGRTGVVVPAGAVLEVTPYITTAGPEAVSPHAIWIYTRVKSSPASAQANRAGWIHRDTVKKQTELTSATVTREAPPRGAQVQMESVVARPSFLCSRSEETFANMGCVSLSAQTPVHVFGCEAESAHIELWTSAGLYTNGFVKTSQFERDPCPR